MSDPQLVTYISEAGDGHHSDFDRLFAAIAQELGIILHQTTDAALTPDPRAPLFYSMFDRKPSQTLAVLARTAWRSMQRRKTIGLFFRPCDCFLRGSIKSWIRKYLFTFVSRLPHVSILSIVPFTVSADIASVASDWIYDPQLWDMSYLAMPPVDDTLKELVNTRAQGRRIIVALGGLNARKGFDYFAELWCASSEVRKSFLFVAAGKVATPSQIWAQKFENEGGVLINRRINDSELFSLYASASAVWCCYAPDYDQSSGIHGRAVQLGLPVIVRQNSLIETLGFLIEHPVLSMPFALPPQAASLLANWQPVAIDQSACKTRIAQMREHSQSVLRKAFT